VAGSANRRCQATASSAGANASRAFPTSDNPTARLLNVLARSGVYRSGLPVTESANRR